MVVWNKGLTKESHPALRKTSDTMRKKNLDNFKKWREEMKRAGKMKSSYPRLREGGDLAELLGIVLGDGHIQKHDRCESLRIVGDSSKMGFITHSARLMHLVFKKRPSVKKRNGSNAVNITIYEKQISARLAIPTGSRAKYKYDIPRWIEGNKKYTIRFLRGLYEAEGSISHSPATYTHKFIFSNANPHLRGLVEKLVKGLGFTVSNSANKVQVSRGAEVQKLANLVKFRHYKL